MRILKGTVGLLVVCAVVAIGEEYSAAHEAGEHTSQVRCEHSKLSTGDASPLGKGGWQFQLNSSYAFSKRRWTSSWQEEEGGRSQEWRGGWNVGYGVRDDLDLSVGAGHSWLEDEASGLAPGRGLSDPEISAKWNFLNMRDLEIAFAYLPRLVIPAGSAESVDRLGPGQGYWTLDTRFAVVKDWPEHWSANWDAGDVSPFGNQDSSLGDFSTNIAFGHRLYPWLQPELELNYNHHFISGEPDADWVAVTAGAGMPLSDRVCIRAGIQRVVAGRSTDQTTTILLSADLNF